MSVSEDDGGSSVHGDPFCVEECEQLQGLLLEIDAASTTGDSGGGSEAESVLTEPTDSPFRVRRVSRSFSISNASLRTTEAVKDELFCSSTTTGPTSCASVTALKKSRFILLRRSRSLGHIFQTEPPSTCVSDTMSESNRSETAVPDRETPAVEVEVEALEVEVFPPEDGDLKLADELATRLTMDALIDATGPQTKSHRSDVIVRPQTSPPVLLNAGRTAPLLPQSTTKTRMLDRMQRSIGFLFRCARGDRHEQRQEREEHEGERQRGEESRSTLHHLPVRPITPNTLTTSAVTNPSRLQRSLTQTAKLTTSTTPTTPTRNVAPAASDDIPTARVAAKSDFAASFVTKVDAVADNTFRTVRPLPQFYDVLGPKAPLLKTLHEGDRGRKCLVLDLDETLVHSSFHIPEAHDLVVPLSLPDGSVQNIYVAKRPGVDRFLALVCQMFEVVIFTASLSRYADPVIDFLTEEMNGHILFIPGEGRAVVSDGAIRHRLYRESCLFLQGLYVKDLSRLGRDLAQTVIIDNSPASFLLQPENGVSIKSWFSDPEDRELEHLLESLRVLVECENVATWRMNSPLA